LLVLVTALAAVTTPVAAADLPPGGTFRDDDGNIHEGNIEAIAAEGITRGCNPPTNDRYCPANTVTRGQMAAFLARTLGLPQPSGDHFVDDETSIFENDINRLFEAGITRGCNPPANDRYCPDNTVTRGQMAAFLVRAYGYSDPGAGDWFDDDDGSVFENDIDKLRVAGVTKGCNPPANTRYCPDDGVRRDQMATFLARAEGLTPIVPPPRATPILETVVTGLSAPVFLTSPPGDDRLFIVEQRGTIRVVENDALKSDFFLDLRGSTNNTGEQGLLSMAFHPNYASNGKFYVYQSRGTTPATSYIDEYRVSGDPDRANASSRRQILSLSQPASNHNGGQIEFGPDGYLWIGFGDGGGGDDPFANGQNLNTLHGALLRIDVDSGSPYAVPADNPFVGKAGRNEIWAYGLRNPWRWSFHDGDLYIGDVGQGAREEIDIVPLATGAGSNFGWCLREGLINNVGANCNGTAPVPLVDPVLDFRHSDGNRSITGGRVYTGPELPDLVGHYFHIDYGLGRLQSFEWTGSAVTAQRDWTSQFGTLSQVASFGSDAEGRLYLVQRGAGVVRRLTSG
jgi:glucose/arabinose dehydrogenase